MHKFENFRPSCLHYFPKKLARDKRGSVAAAVCLMVIPVILSVGLAIDAYRMIDSRQMMQDLVDDAALAGAGAYTDPSQQAQAGVIATNYFNQQKAQLPSWLAVSITGVDTAPAGAPANAYSVAVSGQADIKLYFGNMFAKFVGGGGAAKNNLLISTSATATNPILTISFNPLNQGILTDDWDTVYYFPLARDGSNNTVYNYPQNTAVPVPAGSQLIFSNCHQSIQQGAGYYTPAISQPFPTRCNKHDLAYPSNIGTSSSTPISSTQQFGFVLVDETSGNEGDPNDDTNWQAALDYYNTTCTVGLQCTNTQYNIPQAPPNIFTYPYGYIGQYGEFWHTHHYFYSTYPAINLPPDQQTDALDLIETPGSPTFYQGAGGAVVSQGYPATPGAPETTTTPLTIPVSPDWTQPVFPNIPRNYTHTTQNCSLQVSIVDPSNLPSAPPQGNGGCFNPGSATSDPAFIYGSINCAKLNGTTAMYWWSDMGDLGLDIDTSSPTYASVLGNSFKYTDAEYTVSCGGNSHQMVYLSK